MLEGTLIDEEVKFLAGCTTEEVCPVIRSLSLRNVSPEAVADDVAAVSAALSGPCSTFR